MLFVFLKKSFFGTMVYRAVVCTLEKRSPGVLPCWWFPSKIRKLDGGRLKMIIFTKSKMNAIHFQIVAFTSGFRMKTSDFPLNLISTKVQKLIVKIAFPFGVETAIGKMTIGQLSESTMFINMKHET